MSLLVKHAVLNIKLMILSVRDAAESWLKKSSVRNIDKKIAADFLAVFLLFMIIEA